MKKLLVTLLMAFAPSALAMYPYGAENLRRQIKHEKNHQLFMAVRNGDARQVTQALEEGADVNAQTQHDGQFPLLAAVLRGHETVCQMLIQAGANINLRDNNGCDAFSGATGYPSIRKLLRDRQEQLCNSIIVTLGCLRRLKHENNQLGQLLSTNAKALLKPHLLLEKNYKLKRLAYMRTVCQRDENLARDGAVKGAFFLVVAGCLVGFLVHILSPSI